MSVVLCVYDPYEPANKFIYVVGKRFYWINHYLDTGSMAVIASDDIRTCQSVKNKRYVYDYILEKFKSEIDGLEYPIVKTERGCTETYVYNQWKNVVLKAELEYHGIMEV